MPLHNVQCNRCDEIIDNYNIKSAMIHKNCGGELEILWTPTVKHDASVHPLDRTVIYMDPKTGDVVYPARADVDIPERYRKRGYEKVAFEHARELERFERQHNVANEKYWYNSGNGV